VCVCGGGGGGGGGGGVLLVENISKTSYSLLGSAVR
jgi:hypothetical protein